MPHRSTNAVPALAGLLLVAVAAVATAPAIFSNDPHAAAANPFAQVNTAPESLASALDSVIIPPGFQH